MTAVSPRAEPTAPECRGTIGSRLRRRREGLRRTWRTTGPLALPLLVLGVMQWVGTLASPALLEPAPLLLAFLSPRAPFLIYASSQTPLVVFVLVASIRSLLADPVNYCIGRRLGPALFERIEARGGAACRMIRISERVIDRCGVVAVACRPNGAMLGLAGARKLNPVATGVAAVFGTGTYVTALALTADAAASPMQGVLARALAQVRQLWQHAAATPPAVSAAGAVVLAVTVGGLLWWWSRSRQQPVLAPAVASARHPHPPAGRDHRH